MTILANILHAKQAACQKTQTAIKQ